MGEETRPWTIEFSDIWRKLPRNTMSFFQSWCKNFDYLRFDTYLVFTKFTCQLWCRDDIYYSAMHLCIYAYDFVLLSVLSGVELTWEFWAPSVRSKLSKLQALSPGRSFLFAWPTVNTKSRLWPSVFSVRLFQTQYQLAAGDVSTNLSHFHWRSRTLWNSSSNANNFSHLVEF